MTEKELRKLSKKRLVKLFTDERKKTLALTAEIDGLKNMLEDKRIKAERAGSIAEAALSLNGVFEAAENACRQYVDNVKEVRPKEDRNPVVFSGSYRRKADAIIEAAKKSAEEILTEAKRQGEMLLYEAEANAARYLDEKQI